MKKIKVKLSSQQDCISLVKGQQDCISLALRARRRIRTFSRAHMRAILVCQDPLDLAELHSFRLVYFKHKEIFLAVCIVSDEGSVNNYARLPV